MGAICCGFLELYLQYVWEDLLCCSTTALGWLPRLQINKYSAVKPAAESFCWPQYKSWSPLESFSYVNEHWSTTANNQIHTGIVGNVHILVVVIYFKALSQPVSFAMWLCDTVLQTVLFGVTSQSVLKLRFDPKGED